MQTTTIDDVCELVTDGTHYTPKNVGAGIPFLTVKDVTEHGLDLGGCSRITVEDYDIARKGNCAPQRGDVLFSKDGTVGKVHVVETEQPFAVLSSLAILRPRADKIYPRYLGHILRTPAVLAETTRRKTGSAIRRVILSDLKTVHVPLPSLIEQRRIAETLDRAEALRAKRCSELRLLDELEQSIFLDTFGDPLTNPNGWPVVDIAEVCELIVDCVNRTALVLPEPTQFKMIRTSNVRDGEVDLSEVRHVSEETFHRWNRRATPRRGDVILTREAPVGEVGVLRTDDTVFLGQRLMLYRPDPTRITSEYLLWAFRGPFLREQFLRFGSGSTVKHLPLPACRSFRLHLPSLDLQLEFNRRIGAVRALRDSYKTSLVGLSSLFSSLQHRAFRGEL